MPEETQRTVATRLDLRRAIRRLVQYQSSHDQKCGRHPGPDQELDAAEEAVAALTAPLTPEATRNLYAEWLTRRASDAPNNPFLAGIRAAERAHGI